ncbi:unnamed protein product [Trichogramma brassicae]|uniref:Lipid storage droplets surface-binding protein 1 n=1 Tax=Trichogramma brassicae TaxID=86971 RepID=A0A6H5IDD9_9HYME|nr:unnamed protein product [Trichogramma brassicae]
MSPPVIKRHQSELQLESVAKLSSIPIVESGIYIANSVYEKIKRSNFLMGWGLDTAEHSLALATGPAISAMHLIALQPIMTIDQLLCRGIDMVEQRVPAVTLSPQIMYWNTREYVNNKFVKPLLIRADSVKMIGSQAASAAVDRLNGAIDVADQYVDHYLPPDPADKIAEIDVTDSVAKSSEETSKAVRTIEHGARFSRKLQRRLTRRTLAEARALKEQGTECIHVLLYVVELVRPLYECTRVEITTVGWTPVWLFVRQVATDPKLAMQKAKELWASLSLPEPENQARPKNLEQLLVLFTRETARRLVHLVNGSSSLAARAPGRLAHALVRISHRLVSISEQILQVVNQSLSAIEQIAAYLAGRPKSSKKGLHSSVRQSNYNNHLTNAQNSTKNGID